MKEDLQPMITLNNGLKLEGKSTIEGQSFRGIRYGKPPIGSLRWAPPEVYEPTEADLREPYDATELRSVCPQTPDMCTRQGCSEDCLFLNVFRIHCFLFHPHVPIFQLSSKFHF